MRAKMSLSASPTFLLPFFLVPFSEGREPDVVGRRFFFPLVSPPSAPSLCSNSLLLSSRNEQTAASVRFREREEKVSTK